MIVRISNLSRILSLCIWIVILSVFDANSQSTRDNMPDARRATPAESSVTTSHEATIKGQRIPYTATAGTQPVWDEDGKEIATLFYVYYERSNINDKTRRPLVISFNGGPGSASVWMHIGYTGPKFLNIDDEGFPTQPYGVGDNPHSILDVADIVYVDPVNVGFSRILGDANRNQFFGVNSSHTSPAGSTCSCRARSAGRRRSS